MIEEMGAFFDKRADEYEFHMLEELKLEEFYDCIADCFDLCNKKVKILDLGCGTGLEIDAIFRKLPNTYITGIDLSKNMLDKLKEKFTDKKEQLNLIQGSYIDIEFDENYYDYAVSTYSLHHFDVDVKLNLYKKVFNSLKNGAKFVEGDYTVKTLSQQQKLMAENEQLKAEHKQTDGFYHFDIPLYFEIQKELYKQAGFSDVLVKKTWDNTSIFICGK